MDSKMEKEWKNSNSKKTSHKNLFKIQFVMTNIVAFSESRYFKVYFWREKLDETRRSARSYCAMVTFSTVQRLAIHHYHGKFDDMRIKNLEFVQAQRIKKLLLILLFKNLVRSSLKRIRQNLVFQPKT